MNVQDFITNYLSWILLVGGSLLAWRTGFLKEISASSKTLLDNRTEELKNCQKENVELKEYTKMLMRDALVKAEIRQEDERKK